MDLNEKIAARRRELDAQNGRGPKSTKERTLRVLTVVTGVYLLFLLIGGLVVDHIADLSRYLSHLFVATILFSATLGLAIREGTKRRRGGT